MYFPLNIEDLSHNQLTRLKHGHTIRVKPSSSGRVIHLSKEQMKKAKSAVKKGSGFSVSFDPYQMALHQGSGFFSDLVEKVKSYIPQAKEFAKKEIVPRAEQYLIRQAEEYIPRVGSLIGEKLEGRIPRSDLLGAYTGRKLTEGAIKGIRYGAKKLRGEGVKKKRVARKPRLVSHKMKSLGGALYPAGYIPH